MTPVQWSESALDQLSDAYMAAGPADRHELVAATLAANRELADRPHDRGESRGDGLRVEFFGRLTVGFRPPFVGSRVAAVRVTSVRWVPARPH
jgi:plasmid stabilization system protein ParE